MKNVEDIYSLTPMQETMLFHANMHQQQGDVLFNQLQFKITGELDEVLFQEAWQRLLDRHSILRTTFLWQGLKTPQQVVRQRLDIPFQFFDLTRSEPQNQEHELRRYCLADKAQGFRPEQAPLLRIALFKLSQEECHLVWSSHHLIVDRWCIPIVLSEVLQHYQQQCGFSSTPLPPSVPFKRYVSWVLQQNQANGAEYWHKYLAGFNVPTPAAYPDSNESGNAEFDSYLPNETLEQLRQFCQTQRLTLANVIQAAWGMTLAAQSKRADVVFGVVVSGRPSALSHVEYMLGSFVNNLPVRLQFQSQQPTLEWLKAIQQQALARSQFEHFALTEVNHLSALNDGESLFDSILVWLAPTDALPEASIKLTDASGEMGTAYPLTVNIQDTADGLNLVLQVKSGHVLITDGQALLQDFFARIQALASSTDDTVMGDFASLPFLAPQEPADVTLPGKHSVTDHLTDADKARLGQGREQIELPLLEQQLCHLWQQVLGCEKVNLDDDFFALGGDSIKAAQLLTAVEGITRQQIPMLALFQGRTVADMAKIVLTQDWPLKTHIASAIKKSGSQTPLFCVASPEVNTIGYAALAQHLQYDGPVYVLQGAPVSEQVNGPTFAQIREMAPKYIEAMREIQSQGPYKMLGMCSGAYLALELARELEADAQHINYLGFVNTWSFYTVSRRFYLIKSLRRLRYYYRRVLALMGMKNSSGMTDLRTYLKNRKNGTSQEKPNPVRKAKPKEEALEALSDLGTVGWAHLQPEVDKLASTLTVYRLRKQPAHKVFKRCLGWSHYVSDVQIEHIEGTDHLAVLREPWVQGLAQKVNENLLNLQSKK